MKKLLLLLFLIPNLVMGDIARFNCKETKSRVDGFPSTALFSYEFNVDLNNMELSYFRGNGNGRADYTQYLSCNETSEKIACSGNYMEPNGQAFTSIEFNISQNTYKQLSKTNSYVDKGKKVIFTSFGICNMNIIPQD